MTQWLRHLTTACLALALAGASVTSTAADVLGKDERVRVPNRHLAAAESIGFLFQRGTGQACTAFCVGDDVIATNAHCLVRRASGLVRDLHLFRFMLAPERGAVDERHVTGLRFTDRNQPQLSFFAGDLRSSGHLAAMSDDWAFAKLIKPMCRGRALDIVDMPVPELRRSAARGELMMIGYHGDLDLDWRWLSPSCGLNRGERSDLLFHTCDTFRGSSGAPMLVADDTGVRVVGINVGTFERSRYEVIRRQGRNRAKRKRLINRTVTNVAVTPRPFIDGMDRYARESLLPTLSDFRDLQSNLKGRSLYGGRIDGLMGPMTRRAIENYERQNGMPPLGLPTRELLDHLRGITPGRSPDDGPTTVTAGSRRAS